MWNGPCVRAKRETRSPSGSFTGSVNASGTPVGKRGAECVADPAGVLDRQPALLAGDPDPDRAALLLERGEILRRRPARDGFVRRQVTDRPQQVVHGVHAVRLALGA